MAHGFLTIEKWQGKRRQWLPVSHLNAEQSMTEALRQLERRGKSGLFRVVQTQRMIWAEKVKGKLKLRKWHANSPDALMRTAKAYDRDRGKWPG